ncbi:MAG: hypothetical protein ABR915_17940 [Thermoguttaceae bacterium]|jgi:hypothetical protein
MITALGANLATVVVIASVAVLNLVITLATWPDYNAFGWFAWIWVLVGLVAIVARVAGLPLRWYCLVGVLLVSVLGFCVNAHYLAKITASV